MGCCCLGRWVHLDFGSLLESRPLHYLGRWVDNIADTKELGMRLVVDNLVVLGNNSCCFGALAESLEL